MIRKFLERIGLIRKQSWAEKHFLAVLIVSVAVFMAISLLVGLQQSVWFDEAYSILLAKQPVDQLIHLTAVDTHPPFYYLLLKGWAALFGWSELALRSLSVFAAGGAVAIGALLVRRMFGARAALAVLPFVAIAPFLIRYGFEIRMYALASLIGITATYALVRALETKDSRRQWRLYMLYAALVTLGMLTLYYTAVLWIAHVVWLVWLARSKKQPVMKQRWWLAYIGSALLFVPWLPTFVGQLSNGALAPISQALTVDNLVGIVSFAFVYQPSWQLTAFMSLVVVFVVAALVYFTTKAFQSASPKQKPYLLLLALYLAVPVAVVALISLARPMYVERYLAHVLIGGYLFVGVAVWFAVGKASMKCRVAAGALVAVLLVGVMQVAQVGNYNFQRLQKPEVKEAALALESCRDDKTILAADPYVAIELMYYMPSCDVNFYSQDPILRGGYAPLSESPLQVKNPEEELKTSHEILYVFYGEPTLKMPTGMKGAPVKDFGDLHVATFSAE